MHPIPAKLADDGITVYTFSLNSRKKFKESNWKFLYNDCDIHFWNKTWLSSSLSIFHITDWLSDYALVYQARYTADCIYLRLIVPIPCKLCGFIFSHDNFSKLFSSSSSLTANTPASFPMHCSTIISWLILTILFAVSNMSLPHC